MKGNRFYETILGLLVVAGGILLLVQTQGWIRPISLSRPVGLLVFGASGLAFLAAFVTNMRDRWSAAIFAFVLLGLFALVAFGDRMGAAAGGLFLGAIGASFLVIWWVRRDFWWAIIPAGILLTLAVVASVSDRAGTGNWIPGILFLGMAATFLMVYAIPGPEGRHTWALWPAGILAAIGVVASVAVSGLLEYIVPVLIIGVGIYVVLRALGVVR